MKSLIDFAKGFFEKFARQAKERDIKKETDRTLFQLLDSLPTGKILDVTGKEKEYVRNNLIKLGKRHLKNDDCDIKKVINYIVANLSLDMIEYIKKMYNKRRIKENDMINHFLPPPPPIS